MQNQPVSAVVPQQPSDTLFSTPASDNAFNCGEFDDFMVGGQDYFDDELQDITCSNCSI